MKDDESVLRDEIFKVVRQIFGLRFNKPNANESNKRVQYAGAVYNHEEVNGMINAILDGWFGVGKYTHRFEMELSRFLGVKKKAIMTNSGSSANLLAISALLSNQLADDVKLKPSDEVITPALTFPTTFNPIVQNNLVPVLLDINAETYNLSTENLANALSPKTKAVFIPHTLGNPNDMGTLLDFSADHNLVLIEDSCDALGSKYDGKYLGSFGSFATFSFYPAHQITTGEGGAVVTNDEGLYNIALSLRDWGRACVMPACNPLCCPDIGCPRSKNYRETKNANELPDDYDKRYLYTNIGFNLKPTEIQAAMGIAQLKKLPEFIKMRKQNFRILYDFFKEYEDFFVLPESLPKSDPCWFAFPLTIKEQAQFRRKDILQWLTKHNVEAKMFFAGNITKHPAYSGVKYRIGQELSNSDLVMRNSFFIGVYPGITEEQMNYMLDVFKSFLTANKR